MTEVNFSDRTKEKRYDFHLWEKDVAVLRLDGVFLRYYDVNVCVLCRFWSMGSPKFIRPEDMESCFTHP